MSLVTSYTEEHANLLFGRVPGYKRMEVQLLPSHMTKKSVWQLFQASACCEHVAYTTFCHLWRQLLSHIIVAKSMADLLGLPEEHHCREEVCKHV